MNGRKPRHAQLRKFPYPYAAAFTIASDRHGIEDAAQFRAFHRFLNTSDDTPHGSGLNLEIGDTFWFYDDLGKFSYFKGFTKKPSPQAGLIREFLKAGFIDGLHTYGDFDNHTFERKYAEWAVDEMSRYNLGLPVWINHGGRNNIQNINRSVPYHQGALPDSPAYHLDLALTAGLTYLWQDVTPVIGQDRPLRAREFIAPAQVLGSQDAQFALKQAIKYGLSTVEPAFGSPFGFRSRFDTNRLLRTLEVDDGTELLEFRRFNNHPEGTWKGGRVDDLEYQLHPRVIDQLVKSKGYMIVYNHLEYGNIYDPRVVARLRAIAERYQEGELWVTTTRRMLEYNLLYRSLEVTEELNGDGGLKISISPTIEISSGRRRTIGCEDLQGFCFEIPKRLSPRIFVGDKELKISCLARGNRKALYGTPWERLDYPDVD